MTRGQFRIWSLSLYETSKGFKVVIEGNGRKVTGTGPTPQHAYRAAESRLVVKPWVVAERPSVVSESDGAQT